MIFGFGQQISMIDQSSGIMDEILLLIRGAQKELWLVSPYVTLDALAGLKREIQRALDRKVSTHLLVREDGNNKLDELRASVGDLVASGLDARCVRDLHAKVYWSEEAAVVTSMNLLASSATKSIEVGFHIGSGSLHQDLREFIRGQVEPEARAFPEPTAPAPTSSQSTKRDAVVGTTPRPKRSERPKASHGACIRCGEDVKLNLEKPLCLSCYRDWARWENRDYNENYCHSCGEEASTSVAKPLCRSCYRTA
jgi:hypothetical protein